MRQLACVAMVMMAVFGPTRPASAQPECGEPASLTLTTRPMPHVAAALTQGGTLNVLALGSASLLGHRGGPEGSVPDRMIQALRATAPGVAIRLTLRAARAQTATDMLAILRHDLASHAYQLVLWQTGTVEALRHQPPDQFRRTLAEGIAAVADAGADLVLIDPPYSRLLSQTADLAPYRAALSEAALRPAVMLFPRYALMRAWAEDGQIDLEESTKPDRRRTVERLRMCLGQALAHMLRESARP